MASSTPEPATATLLERAQTFLSENKRAVLLGTAAALAVGGVAYYAATSSRPRGAGDVEKGARKEKKEKKSGKGGKKKKTVKDVDGPILEERERPKAKVEEEDALLGTPLTAEQIAAMSEEERTRLAASFKEKGNAAYKDRRFAQAAVFYTRAIEVTPKPEPVFYSNRAACYVNMQPPQLDLVVEDCDAALKLDSNYVKALNRRAIALEGLDRLDEALRDFTAATILDKFANQGTAQAVERVLQKLATKKAQEILANREPRLPSFTFISAYFAAFRPRPHPALPAEPSTGDQTLHLALQALDSADYAHAVTLVNEAIEQGISWDEGRAEAFNLRGTFKFLTGDVPGAKADLQASLEVLPTFTQSLVKLASVHMEQGDAQAAFKCFDDAIKVDEKDPDIYYHRGQVLFIMNEFTQAAENYTKSTELDDSFVFTHIQLAVAQYKSGNLASSMATFRRTLKAFPQRSEPHNYYGELLLDQQRYEDAVEKFERAVELEKLKSPPNVLPLVNKGLALYQWKQDIGAAERCCAEALRIDPECEAAVATLAQLSLQQSKIEQAVEYFGRQSALARSEPELVNALTYQYASMSQVEFLKNYPQMAAQLSALARGI
ncbi:putative tetratricopeptide repeat [Lyophyllum shimeji]|uniref:Tetratricopeptide repeat n=1 Tax=Lyophyllum shimeji TaxID=47721 RepID=A0A9P3PTR7_LYOSH|nr:putative tetratricopeptide repeat [Lyophyllum shimeji]